MPEPVSDPEEMRGRILEVVRDIPAGRVSTYGSVAAMAGSRSPRLAGRVLATSTDQDVPWYRVLRADGTPAAGLAERQLALLAAEGVTARGGRVDLSRFRWQPDQD